MATASRNFINNSGPPIDASWFNQVDQFVFGGSGLGPQRGTVVATAGQTVFTVPFTYDVGAGTLHVFINGIHQILGVTQSYTETTSTSVTFTEAVPVNAVVEFVT